MISNCILFQFFRSQAESDQGHEGGGVAEDMGRKELKGLVTLVLNVNSQMIS